MKTTLNEQEEINSSIEISEINQKASLLHNIIKNARTPWEPSALKDITLQSALSALRQKELQLRSSSLHNQIS